MKKTGVIFLLVLAAGALVLSVRQAEAQNANLENGKAKYQMFCSACHGVAGQGDGVAAAALDPKPADHSNKEYMGSLTDEYVAKVIKEGGAAVGKSPLMAPWGAALNDQDIKDVVAYIRTLAK